MLLDFIAELATEEYLLAPADPGAQARQNTWHLGTEPAQRAEVTTEQVVAAFEAVAQTLDVRLRPAGPATFYVWHDEQVGALKSSLSSLRPDELLFGAGYEPTGDLASIVEAFLADPSPGLVPWTALEPVAASEPEPPRLPFPVWVRTIAV